MLYISLKIIFFIFYQLSNYLYFIQYIAKAHVTNFIIKTKKIQ